MRSQGQWSPGSRPREAEPATARVIHQNHGREQRDERNTQRKATLANGLHAAAREMHHDHGNLGQRDAKSRASSGAGENYG